MIIYYALLIGCNLFSRYKYTYTPSSYNMTVAMERYAELLDKFRGISQAYVDANALKILKEQYKDEIDSIRVLENITDIKSLLKVLEKHGILQYDDTSVLKQIEEQFIKDKSVEELISNYDKWLDENSSDINNFYSSGKSPNLLNSNKESERYKTEDLYKIVNKNVPNCEDSQSNENLLPIESCNNKNPSPMFEDILIPSITIIKHPKRYNWKNKKYIIIFVIFILLIILVTVIWTLVKISYQSTAIIPKADPVGEISGDQNKSKMAYFASNVNVGFSNETRFTLNQSQYLTSTPIPHAQRERELQNLIVNKISRKVGTSWADISRGLDISESKIDEIELKFCNNPDFENMFKEAISLYFSDNPPTWKTDLMRALQSSARRKDLKEIVQNLIFQHGS